MTTLSPPRQLRVAIYCRQSVASDLEFGSIQAQREAVAAYVLSQRGEGWVALPTRYEDHGFSGGTVERPGIRPQERLLRRRPGGRQHVARHCRAVHGDCRWQGSISAQDKGRNQRL